MSSVPSYCRFLAAAAFALFVAGCDSAEDLPPPTLEGILSSDELLVFRPGQPLPSATFSVLGSIEEDIAYTWNASAGQFESTGTSGGATGRTVRWQPPARGGTYVISVEAVRADQAVADSTSIEVRPSAAGSWSGTVDLVGQEYDWAEFCMTISDDDLLTLYIYSVHSLAGGSERAMSGGVLEDAQDYDYPILTASIGNGDEDDFIEPLLLTGTIDETGMSFQATLDMENGETLAFILAPTSLGCQ